MQLFPLQDPLQPIIKNEDLSSIDERSLLSDVVSIDDFDGDQVSLGGESSCSSYSEDMIELSLLLDDDANSDNMRQLQGIREQESAQPNFTNYPQDNVYPNSFEYLTYMSVCCASNAMRATQTKAYMHRTKKKDTRTCFHSRESKIVHFMKHDDVLLGRGKKSNNHAGNIFFRQMISDLVPQYRSCTKVQKTALANKIVALIHKKGGRFLSSSPKNPKLWIEVIGRTLRTKTSQAMRDTYNAQVKKE